MLEPRWTVFTAPEPKSCILALPGRSQHGFDVGSFWLHADLDETAIVCITPIRKEWYPMPFNPQDQYDAVAGLETARQTIEEVIEKIQNTFSLPRDKIALTGFSAGGVMAVYTAIHSTSPLAGVACHGGAILEPENVPQCKFKEMPIILTHCQDDQVFNWQERYEPMVAALNKNGYDISQLECTYGGHSLDMQDVYFSAYHLAHRLGYSKEWKKDRSNWG